MPGNGLMVVAALLIAWLAFEYHDLFVSKPSFKYQTSPIIGAPESTDPSAEYVLFQITMPCISWADGLIADDACADQYERLEDLVRTNYLENTSRAARLYGAPPKINYLSAEIHTRPFPQEPIISYTGPIVAVPDLTAASLMVENLKTMFDDEDAAAVFYPTPFPNVPLLKGRVAYRRGKFSSYKANYHLLTAQDDPVVRATAVTHGRVLDQNLFTTLFLESVSKTAPFAENICYIDLLLYTAT